MELEIHKTLVLSTSHLTQEINKQLADHEMEDFDLCYDEFEYGYVVYVSYPESNEEGFPPEMRDAVKLARAHSCRYIRYIRYGPVVESLPKGEW